jgi:outer membrane cobalamin receptor
MRNQVLVAAVSLALLACASGQGSDGPSRNRNVITQEEIEAQPVSTAYELVQRLRPTWFRNRGPTSIRGGAPSTALVYIDEVRTGGLEALYRVSTQIIREIQFINGRDATTRWGLDHGGGVIMVWTGRGSP